jgi:hypothetical protein
MQIFYPNSLAETVDAVNEAYFYEKPLADEQTEKTAKWIASRQGLPGAYKGLMFAPTEAEPSKQLIFFSGEKTKSWASTAHILGEEALRALYLLDISDPEILNAREKAQQWLDDMHDEHLQNDYPIGLFCCGKCSVGLFRHLVLGEWEKREQWLAAGMKQLNAYRIGDGKWQRFPFYYTLSALIEIDLDSAREEIRYAAPTIERLIKYNNSDDKYKQRRRVILERALTAI